MKRLVSFLFWTGLFLAAGFGLDQVLVRVEVPLPVLSEVRTFYVDFRARLLRLGQELPGRPAAGGKKAAVKPPLAPPGKRAATAETTPSPRYLYVDGEGELRFADTLEEVPAPYRREAQRLER